MMMMMILIPGLVSVLKAQLDVTCVERARSDDLYWRECVRIKDFRLMCTISTLLSLRYGQTHGCLVVWLSRRAGCDGKKRVCRMADIAGIDWPDSLKICHPPRGLCSPGVRSVIVENCNRTRIC